MRTSKVLSRSYARRLVREGKAVVTGFCYGAPIIGDSEKRTNKNAARSLRRRYRFNARVNT